jgi:leucyl-tRNA synthetase
LEDLDELDWPDGLKALQRNWIGKSQGMEILFESSGQRLPLSVFTTRADTLFGVTFLVISPEHPLLDRLISKGQHEAVNKYKEEVSRKSDLERTDLNKDKTGVFTGSMAIHPITKALVPIFVADYVIMGYGTGIVMGVPGHDERDKEFQEKFGLAVLHVITNQGDKEILINSRFNDVDLNGKTPEEATKWLGGYLAEKKIGKITTQYKLRDWLFSRQRYWGEPFPILHADDGEIIAVMFADPQKINTQAVGQRALIDQIAQHLILRQQPAVSAQGHIAKGIKAKGKCHRMPHHRGSGQR